jgi:alpha-L-fucosidase
MPKLRPLVLALALLSSAAAAQDAPRAQQVPAQGPTRDYTRETPAEKDARMAWWRDARFGMFIHWGPYSVPAGMWQGERVAGIGEWIMAHARIPVAEYEPLARRFNPTQFDADAWVRIAKDAGMKYIIITSKHHDGFALFDSKVSRYDIVNATPYQKDAIKALATASKRAGLRFGVYYSIMDWHHPDAQAPHFPEYNTKKKSNPNFARYVETYMKPQLRELVTQYPEIDVLWFDGEWIPEWNDAQGKELYNWLRSMRPGLIINNRVGASRSGMAGMSANRESAGDFGTPEQEVPVQGFPGVDWETCMTMNDTWGFKTFDDDWKDTRTLVRTLVDVASKGGNFLLNVGPTAQGMIPEQSVWRLREVGAWTRANGESIYGTQVSPYGLPAWGRYTHKPSANRVYAHVFDWPKDRKLELTGVTTKPARVYLLADKKPLEVTQNPAGAFVVSLPAAGPSAIASVLVLEGGQ